jgi:hypothetical protein
MLLTNNDFHTNAWFRHHEQVWQNEYHNHIKTSKINQLIAGKLRQLMLKWVQSEIINIDSWSFNFSQSLCTQKFIGILSDENNQCLNQMCIFFYLDIFFIGCAMSDSLKLFSWPM